MPWNNGRGFYNNQAIGAETTLGDLASMNRQSYGFKGFIAGHADLGAGVPNDWRQMQDRGITQGAGPMRIASPLRGFQKVRAMSKLKGPEYQEWKNETGDRMDVLGRVTVQGLEPNDPSEPRKAFSTVAAADPRLIARHSRQQQQAKGLAHAPAGNPITRGAPPIPPGYGPQPAPTGPPPAPPQGGSTMRPGTQFTALFPTSQNRSVLQGPSGAPPTGVSMYPRQPSLPYTGTNIDDQQPMSWSRKADTGDVSFT